MWGLLIFIIDDFGLFGYPYPYIFMNWQILDTGVASAEKNMALDAELLEGLGERPILHFYEWARPSISHGYFIQPSKFLNVNNIRKSGIDLARRPTGGGIVFHLWDMAFSVLVPASSPHFSLNTLENYAFINGAVLRAVEAFLGRDSWELIPEDAPAAEKACSSFCMAKPTKYDVVLKGRKIAGAAQRKVRQGFLHQGTIALVMPPEEMLRELLLAEGGVAEAILEHTLPLLGQAATEQEIRNAKKHLQLLLQKSLLQNCADVLSSPS